MRPLFERMDNEQPLDRLRTATIIHEQLGELASEIATLRRITVRQLRAQGGRQNTYAAIGRQIGVTPARVKQIESGWRPTKHVEPREMVTDEI